MSQEYILQKAGNVMSSKNKTIFMFANRINVGQHQPVYITWTQPLIRKFLLATFYTKICRHNGILTRTIGVEGEYADHKNATAILLQSIRYVGCKLVI